jgi:hypothetical protein
MSNTITIHESGRYYRYMGIDYDINFPIKWAFDNASQDEYGPHACFICKDSGSINNVFVGYCRNCSNEFNNGRGGGLNNCNKITSEEALWKEFYYMHGVKLHEIGYHVQEDVNESEENTIDTIAEEEEEEEQPATTACEARAISMIDEVDIDPNNERHWHVTGKRVLCMY